MSTYCTPCGQSSDEMMGILSLLILGAGFVALFAGFEYFFLIWILGYAVFLPIVAILSGESEDDEDDYGWDIGETQREADRGIRRAHRRVRRRFGDAQREADHDSTASHTSLSTQDALSTLRERYAQGDLTDKQFERKLDRLLETETPENAAEWRDRTSQTEKSL